MDQDSKQFIQALEEQNLSKIKAIPKSDLHNHVVLGGCRDFIKKETGITILPFEGVLESMQAMHEWNHTNMGDQFSSTERHTLLIEAAFVKAKEDGITILEIGEDVWGLNHYFNGDLHALVQAFEDARSKHAKDIELRLQIGMSRHCSIAYLEACLEPFWGSDSFYSIDLSGDELAQPIENFIPIYKKAKEKGLVLKAHVGEWGTADDVRRAVDVLQLDQVQHGIRAVESKEVMQYLRTNKTQLNITPTSNIKLGRVDTMAHHPIKALYHFGIDVTINSDDILIFDSEVSKEYLRLYQSGTLTAQELDAIRRYGLTSK